VAAASALLLSDLDMTLCGGAAPGALARVAARAPRVRRLRVLLPPTPRLPEAPLLEAGGADAGTARGEDRAGSCPAACPVTLFGNLHCLTLEAPCRGCGRRNGCGGCCRAGSSSGGCCQREGTSGSEDSPGVRALLAALPYGCPELKSLRLRGCALRRPAGELAALAACSGLRELRLQRVTLGSSLEDAVRAPRPCACLVVSRPSSSTFLAFLPVLSFPCRPPCLWLLFPSLLPSSDLTSPSSNALFPIPCPDPCTP